MDNNPIANEMRKRGYSYWDSNCYGVFYTKMEDTSRLPYQNLIRFGNWKDVHRFCFGY